MGDFGSNRAALLIAGFLGRKVMKDMLGRWSLIPVLAVGLCLWTKWKTRQDECRLEQSKLEEVRSKTRQQLHALSKKAMAPMARAPPSLPLSSSPSSSVGQSQQQLQLQRRPGDRLGGVPSSAASKSAAACRGEHISPSAANGGGGSSSGAGQPKDALASELWAWLGGVGVGRVCGADRSRRSRSTSGGNGGGGSAGGGEWRGAFTNRMGNVPRRNAFKTARGKVYLRSASRRRGGLGLGGGEPPVAGLLESVREEDEGSMAI